MPRKPKPPARLAHLPQVVLEFLESQVNGHWDRVVIEHGSPVVVNKPAPTTQRVIKELGQHEPAKQAPARRVVPPEEMRRVELPPDPRTRRKLIEHGVLTPGVTPAKTTKTTVPEPPVPPEPPEPAQPAPVASQPPPAPEPARGGNYSTSPPMEAGVRPVTQIWDLVTDPRDLDQARAALDALDRRMGRRTREEMDEPEPHVLATPSPNGHTPRPSAPLPAPPLFKPPPRSPVAPAARPVAEPLPAPVKAAVTQIREKTTIVVPKHPRYMKKTLQLLGADVGPEDDRGYATVTFRGADLGTICFKNQHSPKTKAGWRRVLEEISSREA